MLVYYGLLNNWLYIFIYVYTYVHIFIIYHTSASYLIYKIQLGGGNAVINLLV